MAKYQCVQIGLCERANKGECFEVGGNFKCGREPEDLNCQSKLEPVPEKTGFRLGKKAGVGAALIVVVCLVYLLLPSPSPSTKPDADATTKQMLKEVWPWLPE